MAKLTESEKITLFRHHDRVVLADGEINNLMGKIRQRFKGKLSARSVPLPTERCQCQQNGGEWE